MKEEETYDSDYELTRVLYTLSPFALRRNKSSVLTTSILLTYLKRHKILCAPDETSRGFTWCYMLFSIEDCMRLGEIDPKVLYICDANVAKWMLENRRKAFLLILTHEEKVPDWLPSYKNRSILLCTNSSYHLVGSVILNLFSGILSWQYELDRIVLDHGSLGELLHEGSLILHNFMCITDSGYNLVAYTSNIEPPDENCAYLIKNGCFPLNVISFLEAKVLFPETRESRARIDDSHVVTNCDVVHLPVYFNEDYFFHLSMPCTSQIETLAAGDFLNMFASRLVKLCATFWDEIIEVESPWHRILTNYIRNIPMEPDYVSTQLQLTAIPAAKQFKLICISLNHQAAPSERSHVVDAAKRLNKGACYPFAFNDSLLVLCYSDSEDPGALAGRKLERDVMESPINCSDSLRVGMSKTFHNISDIDTAYTQTRLALNLSEFILKEKQLAGTDIESYCFAFESVFSYYIFIMANKDNRLSRLSLQHGILRELAAEDVEFDTAIVKLLWTYLANERNATAVSKQLHVHRNTVLYHIEKIEKRYSVDLSDTVTRNNLLNEFRLYFLTDSFTHEPDYDALLSIEEVEERSIL